jgi:16S rRNA (guanine527-N7)-methyltransferase
MSASESPLLRAGLAELGIDPSYAPRLEDYLWLLESKNVEYGLVGATGDTLVIKHLLDSLAPLSIVDRLAPATLADLGTGAGLPGIPLAICRPGISVALVERMGKRCRFLRDAVSQLALDNCQVIEAQVEELKASYDLLTFRAFRPFEKKLFKHVFSKLKPGGSILAYKGKKEKVLQELPEIAHLYASVDIEPIKVPFLDYDRCAVILRGK